MLTRLPSPTCDPGVRKLIQQLAARVIGPRRDAEFLMASLVTTLNVDVNDFARFHNCDCSEGFNTLADMRQAAEKRRAIMEHGWPAQVQPVESGLSNDDAVDPARAARGTDPRTRATDSDLLSDI